MTARNVFSRLGALMVALGVVVGLLFPPVITALGVPQDVALRVPVFALSAICGAVLGLVNLALVRVFVRRPVQMLTGAAEDLADGRVQPQVPLVENTGIFGELARALATLGERAAEQAHVDQPQDGAVRDAERKVEERETLASEFETGVKTAMAGTQKDTQSLQDAARAMGESAESSLEKAHAAIELSEAAAQGVGAVAAAAETMSQNVRELNAQMQLSNTKSQEAVDRVGQAEAMVKELGRATGKIESVAELIIDIADQTNMLALNATIEAARAGEAGKGFAVVAGEVKNLANQTAKATDEITANITEIRTAGERARNAMVEVSKTIDEISTIAGEVTQAADEQNASISDISVNARETSDATGQSVAYIREVGDAIEETGFAAHEMLATVDDLARQIGKLAESADVFVKRVREGKGCQAEQTGPGNGQCCSEVNSIREAARRRAASRYIFRAGRLPPGDYFRLSYEKWLREPPEPF